MASCTKLFILCYLLLYPHYSIAFDHVTIVNEDSIDKEFDNNIYQKNLFQPTSYLNAGYGTLYEHIGTVYQNVHTHYLIVGMKIPTHKDIPVSPQNATRKCFMEDNFRLTEWRSRAYRQCRFFNGLFNQTLLEGSYLYTKIFQILHSDIPALLPNQEIRFLSEMEHPLQEVEHDHKTQNGTRSKRSIDDYLTSAEKHRLQTYWSKYGEQLPSDFDTMYASTDCPSCRHKHRDKRFISALLKGLNGVTRGASIFGRLISSVKKIGGYVFKGIHGLFHHHKVQAIYRAVNTFKKYYSKLKIGELFKFKAYRDLHISKVSLYDKLNKALHQYGNNMNHKVFLRYLREHGNTTWHYDAYDDFDNNWRIGFEMYFLKQGKRLSNLKDFTHKIEHFVQGLDMLSTGRLSQTLIHPRRLLTLLRKVVRDVTIKNSQFVPLYTELYHYYETHSVSFTNTDQFLIIQIPIFFINNKQAPMDLYKLHTVHVPLDKDTYDGKESKYTRLDLKQNHLAISKEEYIDLTQHQLNSCLKLHTDYLCPNLRLTASTHVLSCAAAVFQSSPDDKLIRSICKFTYFEHFTPPPAVLETQDEILLANLPPKWQLVCDNQIDRPIPLDSAIYAIVNKNDLCTCGISAQHIFLYESMRTCTTPDTSVTLYYTHNKALLAYDTSLNQQKDKDDEQYSIKVPEYRAPDISYQKKSSTLDRSSDLKARKKRNIPDTQTRTTNVTVDDLLSLSFPLSEAVDFMETGNTFYIPSTKQVCKRPERISLPLTQSMDFYFNVVTVINFLTSVINAIVLTVCYRKRKDLLSGVVTVAMEALAHPKETQALQLSDDVFTTDEPVTLVNNGTTNTQTYSMSLMVLIALLSMLITFLLYWIFVLLIQPLMRKSNTCRYLFPCSRRQNNFLTPATDLFLDIVHVNSGEQIRVFLTTITAPACSLSFTGSVKISNFKLSKKNLLTTLNIDWHNCLLHYNDHVITLPQKGTAFSFQPNILTSFDRPGPYNIQLLARHMDALLQVPHSSELDFVTASDVLSFPYRHPVNPTCPYQQVHDEVLNLMPLSNTPSASDPTLIDSAGQREHFV